MLRELLSWKKNKNKIDHIWMNKKKNTKAKDVWLGDKVGNNIGGGI